MEEITHGVLKEVELVSLLRSFEPIVDQQSRILILGSMPGVQSLRLQQYYANSRNQFWKLIFALFDLEPFADYEARISFIRSKQIAIWDVIEMCSREGSLDSKIREEQVNDFESLFKTYPNINTVLFNGGKAFETYKKWIGFNTTENVTFQKLTSSSPANTKKYDDKLREWCVIRNFLESVPSL